MRALRNWKFEEIVAFLKSHGFTECEKGHNKSGTSHHYYSHTDKDGKFYLVHVQYHAGKSIPPGTFDTVIKTSGIPKIKWRGL